MNPTESYFSTNLTFLAVDMAVSFEGRDASAHLLVISGIALRPWDAWIVGTEGLARLDSPITALIVPAVGITPTSNGYAGYVRVSLQPLFA